MPTRYGRAGETHHLLGHRVVAPSTLGTFLRAFSFGHARQLDKVAGQLLGRVWSAGAGPGHDPATIDLGSTICETYGLSKVRWVSPFLDIPRPAETREQFDKPFSAPATRTGRSRLTIADLNDASLGPTLLRDLGRRCATSRSAVRTRW
ncbi:MAG: hypothetical protein GEU78_12010 [Actinobacteria bacterium]|nr:hypothetical protein [Actinomycetota bacterium]